MGGLGVPFSQLLLLGVPLSACDRNFRRPYQSGYWNNLVSFIELGDNNSLIVAKFGRKRLNNSNV